MIRAIDRPRVGGQHGVDKGRSPSSALIWGPLAACWGLSAVFSLLYYLFSLPLVVVVLRRFDPMRRVTHSTHDKPCQLSCCCSELERLQC